MATEPTAMDKLADEQVVIFTELTRVISNFNKDGPKRWTSEYLQKRLETAKQLWADMHEINLKIIPLLLENQDHDYVKKNYFGNAKRVYERHLEKLQELIEVVSIPKSSTPFGSADPNPDGSDDSPGADDGIKVPIVIQPIKSSAFDISIVEDDQDRRYRRQKARISTIQRVAAAIRTEICPSEAFLRQKLSQLQDCWQRFIAEDEEIVSFKSVDDEHETYQVLNMFITTEQMVCDLIENIQERLQEITRPRTLEVTARENQVADIKLPPIEIPKFGGSHSSWPAFKELFERIIGKRSISGTQKLQYLKTYLTGNALNIIKHLDICDENFDIAWKLIHNRFNDERMQVTKLIKALVQQPIINSEITDGLRRIHDNTREYLYSLRKLGINIEAADPFISYTIYQKLDRDTIIAYEQSLKNPSRIQPLEDLLVFMDHRYKTLDGIKSKTETNRGRQQGNGSNRHYNSHKIETEENKCFTCDKSHKLYHCEQFLAMTPFKRLELVKQNKLCKICLSTHEGNIGAKCKITSGCKTCGKNHNTLLHLSNNRETSKKVAAHTTHEDKDTPEISMHVGDNSGPINVLLATAIIMIKSGFGTMEPVRALIDQGSQSSFITTKTVQRLQLKQQKTQVTVSGLGGTNSGVISGRVALRMTPRFESKFSLQFEALVLRQLTHMLPGFAIKQKKITIIRHITTGRSELWRIRENRCFTGC